MVAEEVRSLALRAKEAAAKTEERISQSVKEASNGEVTASPRDPAAPIAQTAGRGRTPPFRWPSRWVARWLRSRDSSGGDGTRPGTHRGARQRLVERLRLSTDELVKIPARALELAASDAEVEIDRGLSKRRGHAR